MKTDNEIIAEFMGHEFVSGKWCMQIEGAPKGCWLYSKSSDEFEYMSRWDWLMPVVEKISKFVYEEREVEDVVQGKRVIKYTAYPRTFGMLDDNDRPMVRINQSELHTADTLIEATYEAVVSWIKSNNEPYS